MSDPLTTARLRLWLRSERAMGLSALSVDAAAIARGLSTLSRAATLRPAIEPERGVAPGLESPFAGTPALASAPLFPSAIPSSASAAPFGGPALEGESKRQALALLDQTQVKGCVKCVLCKTRTQTVFGEGDPDAKIFFIGEGPGETEDQTGRPFVGKAGQLLDKMIVGMGLSRERVFIANIVKCRPPGNRLPASDEATTCLPYLVRQLDIVRPRVIVTLGLSASKYMLESKLTMGRLRGQWQTWRGIKLMPTFHPAYLLRAYTDENRKAVWSDLKAVMAEVGLPIAQKNS